MATATKRRKYTYSSRQAAEDACRHVGQQNTVNYLAVNDLANGAVHWLPQDGVYRVGIMRPDSASGGYVLVTFDPGGQSPSTCAYGFDDWQRDMAEAARFGRVDDEEFMSLQRLRQAAFEYRYSIAGY